MLKIWLPCILLCVKTLWFPCQNYWSMESTEGQICQYVGKKRKRHWSHFEIQDGCHVVMAVCSGRGVPHDNVL
jgi:hypothetical protein